MTALGGDRKRGREEWRSMLEDIFSAAASSDASSATPEAVLAQWEEDSRLISEPVSADVQALIEELEGNQPPRKMYHPQISFEEGMRPQPASVHATDDFIAKNLSIGIPSHEGTDYDFLVNQATKYAPMDVHSNDGEGGDAAKPSSKKGAAGRPIQEVLSARNNLSSGELEVNFCPIIIVPKNPTAHFRLNNIEAFMQNGKYVHPTVVDTEPASDTLHISPAGFFPETNLKAYRVQFREFIVVDDPKLISNWDHVCASFVTEEWQFKNWFEGDKQKTQPDQLFYRLRGFYPYFEEDKEPDQVRKWRVYPLQLSRKPSREFYYIRLATYFWQELYRWLDAHPLFRQYTKPSPAVEVRESL